MNSSALESNQEAVRENSIAAVRRFSRFYTRQIGVLEEGLLKSSFTLTEVRVMYELAHREQPTAAELGRDLGIDPGYLSRILQTFSRSGLIKSCVCLRRTPVTLAAHQEGRETFGALDALPLSISAEASEFISSAGAAPVGSYENDGGGTRSDEGTFGSLPAAASSSR